MICSTICPAKINTFLSVSPPDHSNYHPIQSLFQTVSLADYISIQDSTTHQDEIICNWQNLPANNTLTKTLRLARELIPIAPLRINLQKQIPNEAGLGGGSTNAAGLLRCLHKVMPEYMSQAFMAEIAFAVGADVPFFLTGGFAQVESYGEKVTPLPDLPKQFMLIVKPQQGMPTPKAYQLLDSISRPEFPPIAEPSTYFNDFERVAPCICLEISERLKIHGANNSLMTGSGTAVFGTFPSYAATERAKVIIEEEGLGQVFLVNTLSRTESTCTTLSY